jgi:hypothetical protein
MRGLLVVAASALVLPSVAPAAVRSCEASVGSAPAGLPAPVVLRTGCGNYMARPDGAASASAPAPLTAPAAVVRMENVPERLTKSLRA